MPFETSYHQRLLVALFAVLMAPAAIASPGLPWASAQTRGLDHEPYFLSAIQVPEFDAGTFSGLQPRYGHSVALDGDWLLVGVPDRLNPSFLPNGAVFLYRRQGAKWVQSQRILFGAGSARCGHAVSLRLNVALIGCPSFSSDGLNERGRTLVYRLDPNSGQLTLEHTLLGSEAGEQCGYAVASDGAGVNQRTYAAVGCPGRGAVGVGSRGAVRMYTGTIATGSASWLPWGLLSPDDEGNPQFAQWRFGAAVSMEHIGGADPLIRLLVGMPGATPDTSIGAGLAFLYEREVFGSSSWEQVRRFTRPGGHQDDAEFGFSVSLAGGQVAIGAPGAGYDAGAARAGMAYRFRRGINLISGLPVWLSAGSFGTDMAVLNPSGGSRFGHAVALSDDELWIGQPIRVDQESQAAVWRYRFQLLSSQSRRLINDTFQTSLVRQEILGTELGFALGVDGQTRRIAIGAPESASLSLEIGGLALIYERSDRLFADRFSRDHLLPGAQFRDCVDCPTMVRIRGGSFTQGSPVTEPGSFDRERPQRLVSVNAFAIGQTPVTFAQWDACVADGGCAHSPDDEGWGRGDRPVLNVDLDDIQEYLAWLSNKTGHAYRLPSESEWEYAARAGSTGRFLTGDCIGTDQANFSGTPAPDCSQTGVWRQRSLPVASFSPNAFGIFDLHGNAWNWVADCWNESYLGAPTNGSAWMSGDCSQAVLRGGHRNSDGGSLRFAHRSSNPRDFRSALNSFRVARSVVP